MKLIKALFCLTLLLLLQLLAFANVKGPAIHHNNIDINLIDSGYSKSDSVETSSCPSATINYSTAAFCSNDATSEPVTLTGTAGGTFSSIAGLTINASTGAVNPSSSSVGTYTVTYTIAAGGGCSA